MSWAVALVTVVIALNAVALVAVVFVGIPTSRRHAYEEHLWELREALTRLEQKYEVQDPERALQFIGAVDARIKAARFMTPYEAWSFHRCLSEQGLRARFESVDVGRFEDDSDLQEFACQVRALDRKALRSASLSGWALRVAEIIRPRSVESDESLALYAAIRGVRGRHPVQPEPA